MKIKKLFSWVSILIPGILVAATGVGAGDLITSSLAGSEVGLAVLWAALAGAVLKWALNEGLARWQMATETTLLEGWVKHLGWWIQAIFMVYFIIWSYSVGGALINACGVAGAGLFPLSNPHLSKIIWGIIHSLAGLALVWFGGFKVFQYAMSFLTLIMFVTVLATVFLISPDWTSVIKGLAMPSIPKNGVGWMLGVLGGVGGTVTLLSYGYWIQEKKRTGREGVKHCRIDLGVAYLLTAFFGIAMIIIGSRMKVTGKGATVALLLAEQLAHAIGPAGKWIFLLGFWGAVFSSLLGVWQGVPYLFADFLDLRRGILSDRWKKVDIKKTAAYRSYLAALALVPIHLLWLNVQQVQLVYAILGAFFMPLLALTLILLNNRKELVGRQFKNSLLINLILLITLGFFSYIGLKEIVDIFSGF